MAHHTNNDVAYIHTYSFHFINPFSARLHLDMKHVRRENRQHKIFTNRHVKINIKQI